MRQRRSNLNNDSWLWVHRCVAWSKFWMCLIANDCSCKLKKSNPFKWQAVISLIETSWLVKFISTLLIVTAFKSLNYFLFIRACSDCVAILLCLYVSIFTMKYFRIWGPCKNTLSARMSLKHFILLLMEAFLMCLKEGPFLTL